MILITEQDATQQDCRPTGNGEQRNPEDDPREQSQESAAAMSLELTPQDLADIDQAIRERGEVHSRAAVT